MKGQEFGNYLIREKIGEGGMGEVFLAEHRLMGKKAAIKVLRPQGCADAHDVQRFFNEARAASIIDHPGVVQIFDCDFHENRAYLIMEYIEGESLAAMLRRTKGLAAVPDSLRSIGTQIANVLAAAHAKGIVHRDLKPDNVFLESKLAGSAPLLVRILDFGIAKLVAADAPGLTKTGTVLGTPTYMAPEQCAGDRDVDTRADIYSLGCMLFEMAAGSPPFVRTGSGSLITAHMVEPPPLVDDAWPTAPAGFVSLVAQMLAKDPSKRPQTMGEVELRLDEALHVPVRGAAVAPLPTGGPLLAHTVSLATQRQPVIETQIDSPIDSRMDPRRSVEDPTAVLSAGDEPLPEPTVFPPTGKKLPVDAWRGGVWRAAWAGRLRLLGHEVERKHLFLVLVGVMAIGLVTGLVGAGRKASAPVVSPRAATPVEAAVPFPSVPAQPGPIPEEAALPTSAPPLPAADEQPPSPPSPAPLASPESQPLPKDIAPAVEEGRGRGTSSAGPKGRSASSRRSGSRTQPKKEIRGFSDF